MAVIESCVVSYAVLSYGIAFLAWTGFASPCLILGMALFVALCTVIWLLRYHGKLRGTSIARGTWRQSLVVLAALIPLTHVLVIPPYLRDDLIYHLQVPKLIVQNGGFLFDPHNINCNLPMLFEMPLTVTEALNGLVSPFVVNMAVLVGIVVTFVSMAVELFGVEPRLALAAAVTAVYMPVVYSVLRSCYVELFFALLVMLAFRRYLIFRDERDHLTHWWAAMGFLGLACATKYFGLVYLAFVAAAEFWSWRGRRVDYYRGIACAVAVASPWYVKNAVILGNPVFPLLSALFPSPYLSVERAMQFTRLAANYHDGRGVADFMLLPFKLMAGWNPVPAAGRLGFDGRTGPFIALAYLGLRFGSARQRVVTVLFVTYAMLWAASSQQVRFLLPVVLLGSVSGLQWINQRLKGHRGWAMAVFVSVLILNVVWILRDCRRDGIMDLLVRRVSREQFLSKHAPVSYGMAQEINRMLDHSMHRLLTVGTYGRDYYFRVPTVSHTYYDTEFFDQSFAAGKTNPALLEKFLFQERITHVLFDWGYYLGLVHRTRDLVDTDALQAWIRTHSRVVLRQGDVELLEMVLPAIR